MSVSLRNRLYAVYTLIESTTDGVPTKAYHYGAVWWGRLVPPSGHEATVGLGAEHRMDGVIALSDEATVTVNDLLQDEAGALYEVRAVLPRPMLAETHVVVERSRQAQASYYLVES